MAEANPKEAPPQEKIVSLKSSLIPTYTPPTRVHQGNLILPKTPIEAYKMSREIQHKSLEMVGKSLCAQRPANRAVIFLYGLSGAGKSSTLNHLFNGSERLISQQISHNVPGANDVVEYMGSMSSEHWCADELEISFIDAPGYNDNQGKGQDACNLTTIEKFIQQHQQLGLQNFAKIAGFLYTYAIFYPNIVLVTVDASHERLFGKDTDVGKMLRALGKKRLRIVDSKRPNVVFVMTHVCGIPPGQWDTKLHTKAYCLQLLGRRYLKLHAPVVYIENDYEAWGLSIDGEWSVLPSGQRQPLNLFNKCIEVMQKHQDEVGIEAVRLYYENSRNIPLNVVNRVRGESYTRDTKLCDSTSYWLNKIMSPIKCTEVTEVDLKIDQFIKENQITEKDIDLELYPLKFILHKNKLTEVEKIKVLTLPEIESTLIPYRLSNLEKHVICQLFTPIPPKPVQIAPALGCGYNIFENKVLGSVFDTSQLRKMPEHNLILPMGTAIYEYFNTEATCRGVKSFADFAQDKLATVGFRKYSSLAKFPLSSGYNIIDPSSVPKKDCKMTFRIDQTVFRVQLFPCSEFPLCKGFLNDVRHLPERFDEGDDDIVFAFSKFFTKYGNWAIGQTTLGGYVEGVMQVDRENALREDYYTTIRKLVIAHIGNIINGANIEEIFDQTDSLVEEMKVYQNLLKAELNWFGGDGRYHVPTLNQISRKSWNAWTESLKLNPVIIPFSHIPLPLHSILHSHNSALSFPVQRAYEFLTGRIATTKYFSFKRLLGMSTIPKTRAQASENVMSDIVDNTCFPGSSTVLLSTGRVVCMTDLRIGDKILSVDSEGRTCFSPLYLWGHFDPDRETDYLCICYRDGELRVSENHLVFVSRGGRREPVPAGRVCVGDNLEFVCGSSRSVMRSVEVLRVSCIRDKGVYSPFTLNSCLVVDGVLCSVFAVPSGVAQDVSQVHKIGHALFTPLRLIYKTDLCRSISYIMNTTDNTHSYCSALRFGYLTMKPIENLLFKNK